MMHRIADAILGLSGGPVYVLVFAFTMLEASAFVGFLFPGELTVLLGGVLASQGRVSLGWVAGLAILGAIIGDSIGYSVGARWGRRILDTRLGKRIARPRHRARAEELIRARGGWSIVLGRFTAVLRVLVPGLAGMSRMPYRTFLPFNVIGGILWAGGFTLLGYVAGNAWRTVAHYAARASFILAVLVFGSIALLAIARWLIRNEDLVSAWWTRQKQRPLLGRLIQRYDRQIRWAGARLNPKGAFGLYLTVGLGLSIGLAWFFAAALRDVVAGEEIALLDNPISRFMAIHRSLPVTHFMKVVTWAGSPVVVTSLAVVAGIYSAYRLRSARPALFLAGAVAGGYLLDLVFKLAVHRLRPTQALTESLGYSFPSGHSVAAVTLYGGIAVMLSRASKNWSLRVWSAVVASLMAMTVGVSRVYLGVHFTSDVVAGIVLGGIALAVATTLWIAWERLGATEELKSLRSKATGRILKFLLFGGSLGVGVHLLLLAVPGIHRSLNALSHIQPWLIVAALLLEVGSNLCLAQLYRTAVTCFDHDIGFGKALRISMSMFTFSRIVPAGGAAAGVFGTTQLTKMGIDAAEAATAVVFAGVLGMGTLAVIVGGGAAASLLRGDLPPLYIASVALLLAILLAGGLAAYRLARNAQALIKLINRLERILEKLRMQRSLTQMHEAIRRLSSRMPARRELRPLIGWSAANWLLDASALWLIFAALGHRLHIGVVLVGYGVANLATALPITPGGLGLVEAGMSSTFIAFGLSAPAAVVGVLGYRLVSYWLPVLAGVEPYLRLIRAPKPTPVTIEAP